MAIFAPTHRFTRRRQRSHDAHRLCIASTAQQALDDFAAAEQDAAAERNQWEQEWIEQHEPERREVVQQATQQQAPVTVVSEQGQELSVDERLPGYCQEVLDLLKDMLESIDTCEEPEINQVSSSSDDVDEEQPPPLVPTSHQPTTPTHPLLGDIFDATYQTLTQEQHFERTQNFPGVWYRPDPLPAPRPLRPWLGEVARTYMSPVPEGPQVIAIQQESEGAVVYAPAELVGETADLFERAGDEAW